MENAGHHNQDEAKNAYKNIQQTKELLIRYY